MVYNKTKTLYQNSNFEKRLKKQDVVENLYLFYQFLLQLRRRQLGELQVVQPHLALWKDHGARPIGIHFQGQNDQKLIRNIQLGFTNLTAFYDKITVSVDQTDFSMAFDTISHKTLLWKCRECRLDKWTVMWVENQLHYQSQTLVIQGLISGQQTVMSRILQRLLTFEPKHLQHLHYWHG